jgi:riboflavin biosynthesis protein RibD
MTADTKYMTLAIELAWKGVGKVWPNPMVGCVIVKNGKIIGKGFHKKFGGPHAEINALADCKKKGNCPADATMYVSLEPCCHFGKTPPCVNAIIAAGIKKVVAAVKDPTKKVACKGFKILKKADIEVVVGVCEKEAIEIRKDRQTIHNCQMGAEQRWFFVAYRWQTLDYKHGKQKRCSQNSQKSSSSACRHKYRSRR